MASSKLQRAQARLRSMRRERDEQIQKVTTLALVEGGAFLAGYIPAEFPDMATIGGIRTELVVGGVLIAAGLTDVLDDYGDEALALGAGMIAGDMVKRGQEAAQD